MKIGGEYRLRNIELRNWQKLAAESGLGADKIVGPVDATWVLRALSRVALRLNLTQWENDFVRSMERRCFTNALMQNAGRWLRNGPSDSAHFVNYISHPKCRSEQAPYNCFNNCLSLTQHRERTA